MVGSGSGHSSLAQDKPVSSPFHVGLPFHANTSGHREDVGQNTPSSLPGVSGGGSSWRGNLWELLQRFGVIFRLHADFNIPLLRLQDCTLMDAVHDKGIFTGCEEVN